MRVQDVMTSEVVSVAPEATLKEVAGLLASRRISGVPVVDAAARVVGVVSEADILRKEAGGLDARTAGEAMSTPAIVIGRTRDVAEAARLMTERAVNRLPVVDDEENLLGIVTRADLVRAFVRSDDEIARELREDVFLATLWIDPATVEIRVENGEATLSGEVPTKADAQLLEHFAARVPGVVSVRGDLRWRVDEPRLPRTDPRVPATPMR